MEKNLKIYVQSLYCVECVELLCFFIHVKLKQFFFIGFSNKFKYKLINFFNHKKEQFIMFNLNKLLKY